MSKPYRDAGVSRPAVCDLRASDRSVAAALCALLLTVVAVGAGSASAQPARLRGAIASRQSYFWENASLRLVRENGNSLSERGYASGTYKAPVACTIHISPGKDIKASYTIYPGGGSVSGEAIAQYVIKGKMGYFGGYMTIKKATGRFRGTSGQKIGFSGTIDKLSFRVTIKVHGWISR
jgi:hypothetical protein